MSPSLPPSQDLDSATLELLMGDAEAVRCAPGDVVFRRGDAPDHMYLVVAGRLLQEGARIRASLGEGDLFGVIEALSGEHRTSTVSATEDAELRRLSVGALEDILARHPDATERLVELAERQLLRRDLVRLLPELFESLEGEALLELSHAFSWIRLDRGEVLFEEGAPGDAIYVVASGRLRAQVRAGGGPRVVGEIAPGETVGEMAVLTGETRSATVLALRASVLLRCSARDFGRLLDRHPPLATYLTSLLVERLRRANRPEVHSERRLSVAIVPLHPTVDAADFSRAFIEELGSGGRALRMDRARAEREVGSAGSSFDDRLGDLRLLPWFEEQEAEHDFVVYEAEGDWTPWTRRCVSQADRILLVADADADPLPGELEALLEDTLAGARPPMHLVLVHPADRDRPRGTPGWLEPRDLALHHHARAGRREDAARVARLLTGRALGLVLSGGGARGFAHMGVFRALEELGIEVDAIAGTSAGAAMGCQFAMGKKAGDILHDVREEFVRKKPFRKYTVPVYSIVTAGPLDAILQKIADGRDVSDLWVPFFCTSCDLQTGEKVMHHMGPLWKAVRASMSLPGIVPPVVDGRRLLVDGGVLDNIPEEEMLEFCGGRVIVVDVSGGRPMELDYDYESMPSPYRVVRNRLSPWNDTVRVPTLLDVLMRTATVSNTNQRAVEDTVDLVLRPPVAGFGLLDFDAIDRIVAAAAGYALEALSAWGSPTRPTDEGTLPGSSPA